MHDTRQLQEELYNELRGRIREADMTVPFRKGTYFYYQKTSKGKQYKQYCRRLIVGGEGPGSVNEVMKTGPDEPVEEVLFDENVEAEKHEYYQIQAFKVSPNHKMIAYAEDTKGDEIYTVYVINAENGELIGSPLMGITCLEWVDNEMLLYITKDDIHRPFKVLGGFDKEKYETLRKWAVASDGTQVPISIVYRKDLVKLDGTDPLLLNGYGSYEYPIQPVFSATRLSLLDRGFVYAIAHIRGGGEMGRKWYEDGKFLKKKNTFTDFIACAEYLLNNQFGSKDKICIDGASAGGLLIGAVLNMRPDLFKSAVVRVPFVDVLTTMLDPIIPLTTIEWEEWGDPREEKFYFYMKSYSPVDNVQSQNYPNILVTAGLNDPRVLYFEPAKYVAKLREKKTDNNLLLFKCEMAAGHSSKSGRFHKLEEEAFVYAFILKSLDLIPCRAP